MSKYFQKGKSRLNWQYTGHQIKYLPFPAAHSNMMRLTLICALNMCTNTLPGIVVHSTVRNRTYTQGF